MNYVTLLQDFNRIQEDYTTGRTSKIATISDLRSLSNRVYNSELDHDEAQEFAIMFDNFISVLEKNDDRV